MKQSEDKQDCCGLDMPQGLHVPRYDQHFIRAPKSSYPKKNSKTGMKCDPSKIMNQCCHGK